MEFYHHIRLGVDSINCSASCPYLLRRTFAPVKSFSKCKSVYEFDAWTQKGLETVLYTKTSGPNMHDLMRK